MNTCVRDITLEPGGTAELQSPNYPDKYDNRRLCQWLITIPAGQTMRLIFRDFYTEEDFDWFEAGDGLNPDDEQSVILRVSGNFIPANFVSSTNKMWVRFTSDIRRAFRGFLVEVIDNALSGNFQLSNLYIQIDFKVWLRSVI